MKRGTDKLLTTVSIAGTGGIVAAVVLPFLPQPAPAAWGFLTASAIVQVLYFMLVASAYKAADMSQTYPLMRGLAPALVAAFSVAWRGETVSPVGWMAIGMICCGVFGMAFVIPNRASRAGTLLAFANAGIIATYTVIDGAGVRASGAPASYALWLFLMNAVPLLGWALLVRRSAFLAYAKRNLMLALVGGFGNIGSYGLALWAMTIAPVALVAALRETSILFGIAIAALVLGERVSNAQVLAGAFIVTGAIALRLA